MSKINFADSVTIEQAASIIPVLSATHEGEDSHVTPILLSEPGVGKTSTLKLIEKQLGDGYDYIYVDCPSKDYMDIAGTIPNHETKALEQYVGGLFKMDSGKPKVIMLDEVFKVPDRGQQRYPAAISFDFVREAFRGKRFGIVDIGQDGNFLTWGSARLCWVVLDGVCISRLCWIGQSRPVSAILP